MIDFHYKLFKQLIILAQVATQGCKFQYEYNNYNSYQPAYNPMQNAHNSHGNYYHNSFVRGPENDFSLRSNLAQDTQPNDGNVLVVPYPVPIVIFPLDNAKDSNSLKKVVTVNSIKTTEKPLVSIFTTEPESMVVTKIPDTTTEEQQTASPVTNTQPPTAAVPFQTSELPVFAELAPELVKVTESEPIIFDSTTTETVASIEEKTVVEITESPSESITTESYEEPNPEPTNDIIDIAQDEKYTNDIIDIAQDEKYTSSLTDYANMKNKTLASSELSNTTTDATEFEHGLLKYKVKPTNPYEPSDLIDLLDDDSLPALSYNYLNDYPSSTPCAKKTALQNNMIDFRQIILDRKPLLISDLKSNKKRVPFSEANLKRKLMPISDLRAKRRPWFSNLREKGRPIPTVIELRTKKKPVLVSELRAQERPIQNKFAMKNFKIPRYGLVSIPENVREKIRRNYIRTS